MPDINIKKTCSAQLPSTTLWKRVVMHKQIYILILLPLLWYTIFCYLPMFGIVIAFQDYSMTKGITGSSFVGLQHFQNFLTDYNFWRLLRNTLSINFYGLVFGFPAPIIFALLMNELRNQRYKRVVQTVTYMPHFISVVVVTSMVLTFVSSDGLINALLSLIGLAKVSFMTEPKYFYSIYIVSDVWQNLGWSSIIYMSALASIDAELYEAATVDGANRWKQVLHITLPGLVPTISILLIMRIGQMLSIGYEKVMLLYNPTIYETADVISTYVYRQGLLNANYSYSAAVGMFNSIINLTLLFISNYVSKRVSGSSLW